MPLESHLPPVAHYPNLVEALGLISVSSPLVLLLVLGVMSLLGKPLGERAISRLVQFFMVVGFVSSAAILAVMLVTGARYVPIELGSWVEIPHYHFHLKFVFDRLSVPFVLLSFGLCGVIGAFANRYMHRERGFNRFFVFYSMFVAGMVTASAAGTIETLFTGWEMVGLSSALLVAFFHERQSPVRNGLRVWAIYRVSDAALLIAAVVMHHLTGEGEFAELLGGAPWPDSTADITPDQAWVVGSLLLVAVAGKSGLVPFSGWLPRAMEGPTPSSAVFYGALSIHLGAFLLLRCSPILDQSFALSAVVFVLGVVTAIFATFVGRVQTDVKSALSFASLTQVGIIVAEIGVGLPRYVPLVHMLGHACLRTLQFLRAPSLLYDYSLMENALGSSLPPVAGPWARLIPPAWRTWFYRLALERGYLDAVLDDYIVRPVVYVFTTCDAIERRWTDFLSGGQSRESERPKPPTGAMDELS